MSIHKPDQLPVLLESASINSPSDVWYLAGQRVESYLMALGFPPEMSSQLTLQVINKAASDPLWAMQGNALDIAMRELHSLLASMVQHADTSDDLGRPDSSIEARLHLWLAGIPADLERSIRSERVERPLFIDQSGRVRLESTPKMERMHMVPADIRDNLLRRFLRRILQT